MKQEKFQPSEQLAEFLKLIRTGQLFKVQARIHEVKPEVFLDESIPAKFSPLLQAVETGFHSMVEVVLKCGRWGKESLIQALSVALETKRWEPPLVIEVVEDVLGIRPLTVELDDLARALAFALFVPGQDAALSLL